MTTRSGAIGDEEWIYYVASRRLGYSGTTVAKALGITRSVVCRGAQRGEKILLENQSLKSVVEALLTKSTPSP